MLLIKLIPAYNECNIHYIRYNPSWDQQIPTVYFLYMYVLEYQYLFLFSQNVKSIKLQSFLNVLQYIPVYYYVVPLHSVIRVEVGAGGIFSTQ